MKTAYPVFIKFDGNMYLVYIPDFDGYTEGHDFCDAMSMARDYICGSVVGIDEEQVPPEPSDASAAMEKATADKDDIFDYSDGQLTFVDVDFDTYRGKIRNMSVKKNCTLPQWLERKATAAGINFSRVLQDALIEIVGAEA